MIYTDEDIRREAYIIYLNRQRTDCPGDERGDWVEAEYRIKNRHKGGKKWMN